MTIDELMWADAYKDELKALPFTQEEWEQLWKSMEEACRVPLDGTEVTADQIAKT